VSCLFLRFTFFEETLWRDSSIFVEFTHPWARDGDSMIQKIG
jgi:hypothetical protein